MRSLFSLVVAAFVVAADEDADGVGAGTAAGVSDISDDAGLWDCTYDCLNCTGPFYTRGADGSCAHMTGSSAPDEVWFMFGDWCYFHDGTTIRDAGSCGLVSSAQWSNTLANAQLGLFGKWDVQFSDSTGCHAFGSDFSGFATWLMEAKAEVCFGEFSLLMAITLQIVFWVLGAIVGLLNVRCEQNPFNYSEEAFTEYGQNDWTFNLFLPGARVVARKTILQRGQGAYVCFYRCMEIIAQVWVPAALLWYFAPYIFWPWTLILYVLPGFCLAGFEVSNPRNLITPCDCGLLGMRSSASERSWIILLFFVCRPLLLCCALMTTSEICIYFANSNGMSSEGLGRLVLNIGAIYRLAFQNMWGDVLTIAVIATTVLGVLFYIGFTIKPLLKDICDWDPEEDWITFDRDDERAEKFEEASIVICDAACADVVDRAGRVKSSHAKRFTKRSAIICYALAVLDFFAYLYKVYQLLNYSHYYLAGMMTFALSSSVTSLLMMGHLKYARVAFNRAVKTGIPGRRFHALTQWDDKTGIMSLFLSIHGLPLSRPTPWGAFISFFFLVTGTKALADYLTDVVDTGMYESREGQLYVHKLIKTVSGFRLKTRVCGGCDSDGVISESDLTSEETADLLSVA